jgi:hypothetical protein
MIVFRRECWGPQSAQAINNPEEIKLILLKLPLTTHYHKYYCYYYYYYYYRFYYYCFHYYYYHYYYY